MKVMKETMGKTIKEKGGGDTEKEHGDKSNISFLRCLLYPE
jgi:hypothetical protein